MAFIRASQGGGGGDGNLKKYTVASIPSSASQVFNIAYIVPNYRDLTVDNFCYDVNTIHVGAGGGGMTGEIYKGYDANTGDFTFSRSSGWYPSGTIYCYA